MTAITPEKRLETSGLILPPPPRPKGHYAPYAIAAAGAFVQVSISGQTCRIDGVAMQGICQESDDLERPRLAAQVAMLNALAALRVACDGQLNRVQTITRLRGFIRSHSSFGAHTAVLNAASDVLAKAWPDLPLPARTAVGVSSLPDGALIELELEVLISAVHSA